MVHQFFKGKFAVLKVSVAIDSKAVFLESCFNRLYLHYMCRNHMQTIMQQYVCRN